MNVDSAETPSAAQTPAPAAAPDLASIVESKLRGAASDAPAEGASVEAPSEPQKPVEAKPEEKPKDSAAQVYERALAAEKRGRDELAKAKAERKSIETERASVVAEREAAQKELAEAQELAKLAKHDPRGLLRKLNISFEAFGKALASGQRTDPKVLELEARLDSEAKAREQAQAAADKAAQERAAADREARESQAMQEFAEAIPEDCGAVSWLHERDPAAVKDMLRGMVEKALADNGKIPSYEDAAKALHETLMTDFDAMLSVPAFAARAQAKVAPKAPSATKTQPAQQASKGEADAHGARTITQEHVTSAGAGTSERELTREERMERLVAKLAPAFAR